MCTTVVLFVETNCAQHARLVSAYCQLDRRVGEAQHIEKWDISWCYNKQQK